MKTKSVPYLVQLVCNLVRTTFAKARYKPAFLYLSKVKTRVYKMTFRKLGHCTTLHVGKFT